jgi:short-subunit dehydrogenase
MSNNQLALITGASSGIGYQLAKRFVEHGYDVIIAAEDDGISDAAQTLSAPGVLVRSVQVDLRSPDGVEHLYKTATEGGRALDAAALNAGVGRGGAKFVDTEMADDLDIIDLNVRSTAHLAKLVLKDMVARDHGRVLFTSSIASTMPGSYQTVYNASKSFVQSFAEALHDELRDTGVTVTSLMPGVTDTNFFRRAKMLDTLAGRMPKDDPADVARQGFEALMNGEQKVVAASLLSKTLGLTNRVLPDAVGAALNRVISLPMKSRG